VTRIVLVSVVLCLLLTAAADATSLGQVRLKYASVLPRQAAKVWCEGSYVGAVLTGQYNLQLDPNFAYWGEGVNVMSAADSSNRIGTFCADVLQWAPSDYDVYDVYHPELAPIGDGNTPIGIEKAWDLRRLFDQHLAAVCTNDGAAAFQACVWEIVYEAPANAYSVTTGDLHMDYYWGSGWLGTADTWLGNLGTETPNIGLRVLANTDTQDFALYVPGLPADPIPEPVTTLGLLLGGAALTAYSRRRRKANP